MRSIELETELILNCPTMTTYTYLTQEVLPCSLATLASHLSNKVKTQLYYLSDEERTDLLPKIGLYLYKVLELASQNDKYMGALHNQQASNKLTNYIVNYTFSKLKAYYQLNQNNHLMTVNLEDYLNEPVTAEQGYIQSNTSYDYSDKALAMSILQKYPKVFARKQTTVDNALAILSEEGDVPMLSKRRIDATIKAIKSHKKSSLTKAQRKILDRLTVLIMLASLVEEDDLYGFNICLETIKEQDDYYKQIILPQDCTDKDLINKNLTYVYNQLVAEY